MLNRFLIAAALAAIVACSPTAPPPSAQPDATIVPAARVELPTPASVRSLIETKGAAGAVQELGAAGEGQGQQEPLWFHVTKMLSSGAQEWLDLAPALTPGVDGMFAETLTIALQEALPNNPAGVLNLASADRPIPTLCTFGKIEPTAAEVQAWKAAAIAAVAGVTDPALTQQKAECLAVLQKD